MSSLIVAACQRKHAPDALAASPSESVTESKISAVTLQRNGLPNELLQYCTYRMMGLSIFLHKY